MFNNGDRVKVKVFNNGGYNALINRVYPYTTVGIVEDGAFVMITPEYKDDIDADNANDLAYHIGIECEILGLVEED